MWNLGFRIAERFDSREYSPTRHAVAERRRIAPATSKYRKPQKPPNPAADSADSAELFFKNRPKFSENSPRPPPPRPEFRPENAMLLSFLAFSASIWRFSSKNGDSPSYAALTARKLNREWMPIDANTENVQQERSSRVGNAVPAVRPVRKSLCVRVKRIPLLPSLRRERAAPDLSA